MGDQHRGQFAAGTGRPRQISPHRARTFGGRKFHPLAADACIVFGKHLTDRKVWAQSRQQPGCRGTAYCKLLRRLQKPAPVDSAVHIGIKQN